MTQLHHLVLTILNFLIVLLPFSLQFFITQQLTRVIRLSRAVREAQARQLGSQIFSALNSDLREKAVVGFLRLMLFVTHDVDALLRRLKVQTNLLVYFMVLLELGFHEAVVLGHRVQLISHTLQLIFELLYFLLLHG